MAEPPITPIIHPPEIAEEEALKPFDLGDLSPAEQERHLEIWRQANLQHAQSHGAIAGQLTAWVFAILATSSLGGLALAVSESDQLAYPTAVKGALFVAFISTILGGLAAMENYNSAANKARIMGLATRETVLELNRTAERFSTRQVVADKWGSRCLLLALASLTIAGIVAL